MPEINGTDHGDKKAIKIAAIVFGFLIIGIVFLLLEISIRLIYPRKLTDLVPHPILNHTWRPNFTWEHREFIPNGIHAYTHHYNKQGWLGNYDIQLDKGKDTIRIFYVGDSFTEGTCPMDKSMPYLVEKGLNQVFQSKRLRIEVVNTGTSSYSPVLYFLLIKQYLLTYSPDLIVINVDMTDVHDDYLYQATAIYNAKGELAACPPGHPLKNTYTLTPEGLVKISNKKRIADFLRSRSYLLDLLFANYKTLLIKFGKPGQNNKNQPETLVKLLDWCSEDWSGEMIKNVRFSMETLRKTLQLVKSNNVKIMVTAVPHLKHFLQKSDPAHFSLRPFNEIQKICREEGIPYLNSYYKFKEKIKDTDPSNYYIPKDMHFNEKGYFIWAKIQEEFLLDSKNKLLPPELLNPN